MNSLSSDTLSLILRYLPFSKHKIALVSVCASWRAATLLPLSHAMLHKEDESFDFIQGDLSVSLLALLPVASCYARLEAGGLEHVQVLYLDSWPIVTDQRALPAGDFPNVREVHFTDDITSIPDLSSFTCLSLLTLDQTSGPANPHPLPASTCRVDLSMVCDVEDAMDELGDEMKDIITRLTLAHHVRTEVEIDVLSISSLSSCRRLEEIVIELMNPVAEGPYIIKDLTDMGASFKRVILYPEAINCRKCVWAVEFTSGWKMYEGIGDHGATTYIVERV